MQLILILIPILITDIINPVLFAATLFCLGTSRPFFNSLAMLFSFFVTYLLAGVVVAIGFEELTEYLQNPSTFDYILQVIIAFGLLWLAWRIFNTDDYQHEPEFTHPRHMTLKKALFIGAQVNVVGLPLALPYFLAIDRILIANLSELTTAIILLAYNLLYIAPFLLTVLLRAIFERQSDAIFQQINRILLKTSDVVLPVLFVLISLFLFYDSAIYFLTKI